MSNYSKGRNRESSLSHLDVLEAEAIFIIREFAHHARNPVMLYSIGKDSSVLLHLARKAFYPSPLPFPLLHIDTKWKFQDMYKFRNRISEDPDIEMLIYTNPAGELDSINPIDHGSVMHTDVMKTQALKQALDLHKFDMALGGSRRDEEQSRAKERIFSLRSKNHRWDPRHQRPEVWQLFNAHKRSQESFRVFPISNWTELDVWLYIHRENIDIVPLYFSRLRQVIEYSDMLIMLDDNRLHDKIHGDIVEKKVRFRTLGCYPLTGAIESTASNVTEIIFELLESSFSERRDRLIDSDSKSSMEQKKLDGYF